MTLNLLKQFVLDPFVRVAVLSSGGKDSSAAWWWAMCRGWDVTHLVTVRITGGDSWMFQVPGTDLVEHQSKLAGIPWVCVETEGLPEVEIDDLENALSALEIDGIVSGALRSDYQKSRIERMAERLGIVSWTPLWHQNSLEHMQGLVKNGFRIFITGVSCEGLDNSWIGHTLTAESLAQLELLSKKYRFNVDGEGGEYETLVVGGPHLPGHLELSGEVDWDGVRGVFEISSVQAIA
ncbi:MAG: diphthine--ammonia ligase [Candidatus Poseidoniales archaeon]|nr:MAG: diphthine--ammonia ligase [Candidatus Poseidoniales archaeon]